MGLGLLRALGLGPLPNLQRTAGLLGSAEHGAAHQIPLRQPEGLRGLGLVPGQGPLPGLQRTVDWLGSAEHDAARQFPRHQRRMGLSLHSHLGHNVKGM